MAGLRRVCDERIEHAGMRDWVPRFMKRTNPSPTRSIADQKKYWASIGRWSLPVIGLGGLLAVPYVFHLCWVMARALFVLDGSEALPETGFGSHPAWSVLCAIGVALIASGVSLSRRSRKEFQQLEQAGGGAEKAESGEGG